MLLQEYIKITLQEVKSRRLDWYSTQISRILINLIKHLHYETVLEYLKSYGGGIEFVFSKATNERLKNILKDLNLKDIEIIFFNSESTRLDPGFLPSSRIIRLRVSTKIIHDISQKINIDKYIPDFKDGIRHELEHSIQALASKDVPIFDVTSLVSMRNYYLNTQERRAFAAGFYKQAKAFNKPVIDVINEYIMNQKNAILNGLKTYRDFRPDYTIKELNDFYRELKAIFYQDIKMKYPLMKR